MSAFSFVRFRRLKNYAAIGAAEKHGRRLDESALRRTSPETRGLCLSWSSDPEGDPLAIKAAFKDRKAKTRAREYGGAAIGGSLLLGVSPSWIADAGDVHDPKNPRNIQLHEAARKWADMVFGEGAAIATRLDLDERGSGVVDVIVVPVVDMKIRGKTKPTISVNKALEAAFGKGRSFVFMQDSWNEFVKFHLDPDIERGVSKEITQREHVHADIIGPAFDEAARVKAEAEAVAETARIEKINADAAWAELDRVLAAEREKITLEVKDKVADDWADAGFTNRRHVALEGARDAAYAEGVAVTKAWSDSREKKRKAESDREKAKAVEAARDDEARKRKSLEDDLQRVRDQRDEVVVERDAIALEVSNLREKVSKLERMVIGAARMIQEIKRVAPEPVSRVFSRFFRRAAPAPAPSAPGKAGQGRGGAPLAGQARGEGVGYVDSANRGIRPF